MKYCKECGYENVGEAQFCRNCGSKLNESEMIHPVDDAKIIVNDKSDESIITKLFYKTDEYTGQVRFAKTKSISIGVFVIFLFNRVNCWSWN